VPTTKRARQKAARREKIEAQRRAAKRRQLQRRIAVVAAVAVVVFVTAWLITSGNSKKSASSTTSSSTSTTVAGSTTTTASSTTTTTTPPVKNLTQAQANAIALSYGCPSSPTATVNTLSWPKAPAMTISKTGTYYVHMVTTAGTIVIKLLPRKAPVTVNNFVFLAQHNFYNCVTFHRVISGFVIQGGDPTGTGTGGPGYSFKDELPPTGNPTYPLYSLAMANSGPNTNGSQFFIVTGSSGETLPASYSLFGQVVSGVPAITMINNAASTSSSGSPPAVIHRMLRVTISSKA
jgi:cyclophilin family peptidyl-prolyl cis-trans isomerase